MISGSFHVMSQEWRYYSREKSLIHTLHLGELPSSKAGDTVLIDSVAPPATDHNHFSVPPLTIPQNGGNNNLNYTITKNILSTCFGSVGPNQTIQSNKNMIIQFGVWNDALKEILFTPQESGWFMLHGEFSSGLQNSLNDNGGSFTDGSKVYSFANNFRGFIDRQPLGFTATTITQFGRALNSVQGPYQNIPPGVMAPGADNPWNPNMYLSSIISNSATTTFEGIKGVYFRFALENHSSPLPVTSDLTAWLFKYAEL